MVLELSGGVNGKPGDAPTTFGQCGIGSGIERICLRVSGFIGGLTTSRVRGQEVLLYRYNNEVVAC